VTLKNTVNKTNWIPWNANVISAELKCLLISVNIKLCNKYCKLYWQWMVVIGIFCFQFSWLFVINYDYSDSGFGGLVVACWPLVPKFAGLHPAEAVGFLGRKNPQPSFGGEVKPLVPCHSFTACKRSLNLTCESAFRQNYRTFLAHSSTFCRRVL